MAEKILQYGANMGIAFDGDGDRLIVADERGNILDGDDMLAIFAQDLLKQNRLAQNTVVCTQMSNIGLELFLEKLGVHTIRTDVGDKYVLERMLQEKANLGGEQSGHIILLEHTTTGDGLIAALQLIKLILKKKQSLSEFAKDLQKFPQVLVNVKVRVKRPFDEIAGLSETIERSQAELGRRGRILVRYSGTENLARVMIEGKDLSLVNSLAGSLAKIFEDTVGVK
jgi:phosphoglucosamine mutase